MLDLTITNEEKVRVQCVPVTAAGNPAPLDGDVAFEVVIGSCTVERVDATTVFIVSGDLPGDCQLTVSADADLGEGVEPISDVITVHVEGAQAASLGLVADEPVLK